MDTSSIESIQPGDVVEVTLVVKVKTVEHHVGSYVGHDDGRPFSAISYEVGEPYQRPAEYGGQIKADEFTVEIPRYGNDVDVDVTVIRPAEDGDRG